MLDKNYKYKIDIFKSLTNMEKHYLCPMGKLEKVSDQYFVSNRVLFDEEQPIAFEECMLVGNDKYPYIALAIKKEYRHQGLANKLIQLAIEDIEKTKYRAIFYSNVDKRNKASIHVAKRNGAIKYYETDKNIGFIIFVRERKN